jgi:hypothetical protein
MTTPADWTVFIPVASALTGACIGAFASQFIAARNKERDELLREVRSANAACTMAYSITDSFITVKKDIVKPLVDSFAAQRQRFEVARRNFIPGVSAPVDVHFDLQTFTLVRTPVGHLQDIVFKGISAPVRAITVMAVLDRTITGLESFHKERNTVCDEHRIKGMDADAYFGFQTDKGADERYSSTLRNMSMYTDDAIYLSKLLADDLRAYALGLKQELPQRLKDRAPTITSADFSKAADMIPSAEKYKDYETMFVMNPKPKGRFRMWR